MKKFILSAAVIAGFVFYLIASHEDYHQSAAAATTTVPVATIPDSTTGSPSDSKYKDGSYTGTVADAFYGKLQAEAVVSGGELTDVKFLQSPSGNPHTNEVSGDALPKLRAEAITAQSAAVDVISGATQDSNAFVQTLSNALTQAQ